MKCENCGHVDYEPIRRPIMQSVMSYVRDEAEDPGKAQDVHYLWSCPWCQSDHEYLGSRLVQHKTMPIPRRMPDGTVVVE